MASKAFTTSFLWEGCVEVEKNSSIVLPGKGSPGGLMPSTLCPPQLEWVLKSFVAVVHRGRGQRAEPGVAGALPVGPSETRAGWEGRPGDGKIPPATVTQAVWRLT